jgi:DNA-binding response OmpR family regulator
MTAALTPRPRALLDRLAAVDGPVDRWALVDQLRIRPADDDGPLRTYISRLRDFLGDDAIATVRGVGYRLTEKGRAAYALLSE